MKRLLQISFDTLLLSLTPIIIYSLLGFILVKDLVNIFSITYPAQFLFFIIYYLFAVGPNVTATKRNDESIVYSNMLLGLIVGGIITAILCFYSDEFLHFMNVDPTIYINFCMFSFIMLYLQTSLRFILEKKYYDGKNKYANTITILFNALYLIILIGSALLSKSQTVTIYITVISMGMIFILIFFNNYKPTKWHVCILDNIRYTMLDLIQNIAMSLIYLIGFRNTFSFGNQYIIATTLVGLATDVQWDMSYAIDTAAKIDISGNKFNMKKSLKEGYQLLGLLLASSFIILFLLYPFYRADLMILLIYFGTQIIDMLFYPITVIRQTYLQIHENIKWTSIHKAISNVLRILCSFIYSPFCTYIGQIVVMVYDYIYVRIASRNKKELQFKI